ncbi:MAG TPA: glycosyltransferase family 4 protein [Crinalium sp.]|jgi:glycosyltransferase involved in cell wall biosynthesis
MTPSTSNSLRVIAYTDSPGVGGAEISLGHLVAHASKEIDITIIGVSPEVVNAIANRRPQAPRILLSDGNASSWLEHWWTFRRLKPDIIHINLCTPWAGAIGLSAALAQPHARVVRVDQLPLRTTDAIDLWRTRALSLRVDAHVAVGEASARRMEDFYALGRNSVLSIPNGVPDRADNPPPFLTSRDGTLTVGSIGRLDAMKAHDVLLRAIAQVDRVHAIILGDGNQRTALEQMAEELGIRDRLHLPGWVDEPHTYFPKFDIVAMPSRSEGFPLAVVEAMLAARPVIATRVGSMPEAVIDGETGMLIEKNDVAGLAHALRRLRDDVQLRCQLGRQARERAIAHYTAEAMTQQYEQLWKHLLQTPQSPRLRVPRPRD